MILRPAPPARLSGRPAPVPVRAAAGARAPQRGAGAGAGVDAGAGDIRGPRDARGAAGAALLALAALVGTALPGRAAGADPTAPGTAADAAATASTVATADTAAVAATAALGSIRRALAQQAQQLPAAARVEIVAGTLDPRLRLAPCRRIEPYLPAGSRAWGRTRVGLRCVDGPVRWNVYLPLTVHVWAPALVTTAALPAGHVLGLSDLRSAEVDLAERPARAYTAPAELLGRSLAVALPAGATLRSDLLRLRQWFQAGDRVTVVAQGRGYSVSGEAQALGNGVEGQNVRLRTDSGRILTARPVAERRVELLP